MLRKRLIFTLVYADGFFNQSRNFRLQKVGNIRWLERNYKFRNIAFSLDELIVLNASKNDKGMAQFSATLAELVDDVFIPIAAGGGIRSMEDAEMLFANGADKIVLNSCLYTDKGLVKKLVEKYGSQSIVAAIDYKGENVFISDGAEQIEMCLSEYIKYISTLNVGEVYLNSIEKDGTGFGYDISLIEELTEQISVPLIIAGGAGNEKHLIEGLEVKGVNAVATANLFNFIGDGLPNARVSALESGCNLANWKIETKQITKKAT
jgi:imidazole glycerol-phosphate synthase subunit HisF